MTSDGWDDNIGEWKGIPLQCECVDIPFTLFLLVEGSTKTGEALVLLASEVGKSTNMKLELKEITMVVREDLWFIEYIWFNVTHFQTSVAMTTTTSRLIVKVVVDFSLVVV